MVVGLTPVTCLGLGVFLAAADLIAGRGMAMLVPITLVAGVWMLVLRVRCRASGLGPSIFATLLSLWVVAAFYGSVTLHRLYATETHTHPAVIPLVISGVAAYVIGPLLLFIDGLLMPDACKTPEVE
ncbi:MAG: hypothetical protein AAF612_08775 [Planctomycetota bacterium]